MRYITTRELHILDKCKQNVLYNTYLGKFFEDKIEKGLFQIVDVQLDYCTAHNGKINIKRKFDEITLCPPLPE